jgi:hypothetical protein
LPVVSVSVAAATSLLLALLAPFAWWVVALLLAGDLMMFEYSVMARNYGISALLLLVLAAAYPRWRAHGVGLGVLLYLLANTNVHCVLLAAAFLLFWLVEVVQADGVRWGPALRVWLVNAVIAGVGMVVCFVTVYPPANDAAAIDSHRVTLGAVLQAVALPGGNFGELLLDLPRRTLKMAPALLPATLAATSALLFGVAAGLWRRAGAALAAVAGLLLFSLFFVTVYPGSYRHEGLWLFFVLALYWIVLARGEAAAGPRGDGWVGGLGTVCLVALLVLQVPRGAAAVAGVALGARPLSRSRDLAALIESRPELRQAVLLADPDFMLEAMPYYVPNRLYFLHEQRFGTVVKFTLHARLTVSLADMLAAARRIAAVTRAPVLMVLTHKVDQAAPAANDADGYGWNFTVTPAQARDFLAAAHEVAALGPAVTDESYTVYELN